MKSAKQIAIGVRLISRICTSSHKLALKYLGAEYGKKGHKEYRDYGDIEKKPQARYEGFYNFFGSVQERDRLDHSQGPESSESSEFEIRCRDEIQKRRDQNDEVNPVPKILQISVLAKKEAERDDSHDAFDSEDDHHEDFDYPLKILQRIGNADVRWNRCQNNQVDKDDEDDKRLYECI